MPAVPDRPDEGEVRAAVEVLLDDTLGDFPFASEASAAGALALMLTPVVRPAIEGNVPLALLDATKAGTGKGLLASVAATIATGRPAAVLPAPTREEEWAKTISAQVVGGSTFNLFDEVRELDSPTFAAALTSRVFDARMLGRTEVVRVAQRSTWVAAGNNVAIGGDLARRTYRVRLDAQVSRPWRRNGWRHPDLESWVAENRGRLLAALLTLARAYFAAGRPKAEIAPLGGFDAWAQTIGGILIHAGVPGFLTDLEDFYDEADAESAAWQAFLDGCGHALGDGAWLVGDLAAAINRSEALKQLLPTTDLGEALDRSARSFTAKLGKALSARNGTRFGDHGVRVEKVGVDSRSGSARWAIRAEVAPWTSAAPNRSGEPDAA